MIVGAETAKPGLVDRLRARYGWFDHGLRAHRRYSDCQGNFYAAGLTYFTVFAIFPLLMLGFSTGGFVLSRRPDLLRQIEDHIRAAIPGAVSQQLIDLMDSAIASRASVGAIGLAVAGWAGLSWMAKLREALSQMWRQQPPQDGFVRAKLSDLAALVSAFVASVITIGLTALSDASLMATLLSWVGVPDFALWRPVLQAASLLGSLLVSWLLFTWMIARLPREPVSYASTMQAGLLASVGFEAFKQGGSIYLRSVVNGPAGATFGPVLGVMVFAYITARLVLFAATWAAVSGEAVADDSATGVEPPGSALVAIPPVGSGDGRSVRGPVVAVLVGAAAGVGCALGLAMLLRRLAIDPRRM